MRILRSFTLLLVLGLLLFGLLQCNSQKLILVETPPFTLGDVASEGWVAGVEGGGSGTNLYIPVEKGRDIILDSVYFREKITGLERIQRDSYLVYIGRFKNDANQQKDMVLHENPKKEFGNTPPKLHRKFPFELKDNEAVVRFTVAEKTKYYKIENIREATPVRPRATPKKGE